MPDEFNNADVPQVLKPMHNDLLVKKFNNLEQVKSLLQLAMTPEQQVMVDFDTLTIETNVLSSPTSPNARCSDLCVKFRLKEEVDKSEEGIDIYISIVIDHNNSPDRELMIQLLQCMASLYLREAKVVLPMVLYHGESEWVGTKSFSEFMYDDMLEDINEEYEEYLLDINPYFVRLKNNESE